ncbi:MAG: FAD-dependent oxidoreductase [Acidimicrobiales bacterium]
MSADRYDVVIVGAGLAGLRAAQVLDDHGLDVLLVERAARIGGRVHSFEVDGFVVDEGFQLVNPSYPELRAAGVVASLDLRPFPGLVSYGEEGSRWTLADPRRWPLRAISELLHGRPRLDDAWRLARLLAEARVASASRLTSLPDRSTREGLEEAGLSDATIEQIVAPFLRGALLDDQLETSWRYTRLLLKSLVSGRPSTPSGGVRQLPRALIASASKVDLRLGQWVRRVSANSVHSDEGQWRARAVLVATDQDGAASLLGGSATGWRPTTTWWFATPRVVHGERLRLEGGAHTITSMLDLASVAPERAPAGRSLIAVAVNGLYDASRDEALADVVARFYDLDRRDVDLVVRTPVDRALPRVATPLDLTRPSRRGDVFVAGDYLQTPSIQGALVSGRRAATAIVEALGAHAAAPRARNGSR